MCYFPVKCLKAIIFIGSILAIAISIGLLSLTIYVQVREKQIINAISQGVVNGCLITLFISSILFLVLGVAGLSGSMKGSSKKSDSSGGCLLGLFSIGITIFFILFGLGTVFFFFGPQIIFGDNCTEGSKTNLIQDLHQTSQEADQIFCQTSCPCKITDQNSALYTDVNNSGGIIDDNAGAEWFEECQVVNSSTTNIQILSALENLLNCGGWCPKNLEQPPFGNYTYRFRNINDCKDSQCLSGLQNCYEAFKNFMTGQGRIIGFGCMGAALVCLLNIVSVCCLCLHPSKRKKGSNFYSQMVEEK